MLDDGEIESRVRLIRPMEQHHASLKMMADSHWREVDREAFAAIWNKTLEDDGFNRLVLGAGLSGRQVSVLRAYAKYMRQTGVSFSQSYIEETLILQISYAQRTIEAVPRSKDDQQHLDLDGQSHVIVVSNQTFLQDGRQFEYTESRHTLDKFYFSDVARR